MVQALHRAGRDYEGLPPSAGLARVDQALDAQELTERDRALLGFVARLTLRPRGMTREDLLLLGAVGLSERLAHDVVHVVACFAYMNRIADGLGVRVPADREDWACALYGDEGLSAHLAWAEGRAS